MISRNVPFLSARLVRITIPNFTKISVCFFFFQQSESAKRDQLSLYSERKRSLRCSLQCENVR